MAKLNVDTNLETLKDRIPNMKVPKLHLALKKKHKPLPTPKWNKNRSWSSEFKQVHRQLVLKNSYQKHIWTSNKTKLNKHRRHWSFGNARNSLRKFPIFANDPRRDWPVSSLFSKIVREGFLFCFGTWCMIKVFVLGSFSFFL